MQLVGCEQPAALRQAKPLSARAQWGGQKQATLRGTRECQCKASAPAQFAKPTRVARHLAQPFPGFFAKNFSMSAHTFPQVADTVPVPTPWPPAATLATAADVHSFAGVLCEQWCDWRELQVKTLVRPPLQPGQVRLAMHHVGIGFALKLFVSGKYQRKPPLPFTPCTEGSGVVVEVGEGVTGLRVGQRVAAALDWGALAQEAVVTAETVYPVPDELPLALAAALPLTYGTTWAAFDWRAKLQAGEVLLVHGASGALGMAAVQIGRSLGATVIATASTEEKREAAIANGAHHALTTEADRLAVEVKALTGGRGADVVFDPVGGALFDASLRCTAPEGRMLSIGYASGTIPQVALNLLLVKNISLIGFNFGYYIGWGLSDERRRYAPTVQALMHQLFDAVARGDVARPMTTHVPFANWQAGLALTMNRQAVGKVVIDMV